MIEPVIFLLNGVVPQDRYLLGQASWPYAVMVSSAHLTCRTGSETAVFQLEVDGVLQPVLFTVLPADGEVNRTAKFQLGVAANAVVRWKMVSAGADESAPSYASITMQAVAQSVAEPTVQTPELAVHIRGAGMRLKLFTYDLATQTFSETSPGIASGRAAITDTGPGTTFSVSVEGVEAMRVASEKFYANGFMAIGTTAPVAPKLEWRIGSECVMALSKTGRVWVRSLREETVAELGDDDFGFSFYSAGVLTATLTLDGLTVKNLEEPIP